MESKDIFLNIITVPTVDNIGKTKDVDYFEPEDIMLPKNLKVSSDNKTYILKQDCEMGRGWAVFMKISSEGSEIINQDHRDNIWDELLKGDFIKSFGIDYSFEYI